MIDATQRAWAYLSRVVEPPCSELAALVTRVGPVEAAERVRRGQVDESLARRTEARRDIDRAAADLELLARRGGRLLTPGDEEWPVLAFAAFGGVEVAAKPQGAPPQVVIVLKDDGRSHLPSLVHVRIHTGVRLFDIGHSSRSKRRPQNFGVTALGHGDDFQRCRLVDHSKLEIFGRGGFRQTCGLWDWR